MILLWTVEGDIHATGLQSLCPVLRNQGAECRFVLECSASELIRQIREFEPGLVIVSSLFASTVPQIASDLTELRAAGILVPVLVTGSTMTSERFESLFQAYPGDIFYCKNILKDPQIVTDILNGIPNSVSVLPNLPTPPDYERHIETAFDLNELWKWINPRTLFSLHLGYVGPFEKDLQGQLPKAAELHAQVEKIKTWVLDNPEIMKPQAIWQFFRCQSEKNTLRLYSPNRHLLHTWVFPRQSRPSYLCLADYVSSTQMDTLGLFVATAGQGVAEVAQEWLESGRHLDCLILQSLAVQTAESVAEYMHLLMRQSLGAGREHLSLDDIQNANYAGKRFSFGYGACPNLSDQDGIFKLLEPEKIGVSLTKLNLMRPQASVSALVFHHPEAGYFSV